MAAPLASVREIEREVATLRLAPGEDMPYQRTSVMTHTAWVPTEWVEAADDVLAGLAERHPSRTIVLVPEPDAEDGLEAEVDVDVFQAGEGRQICAETIHIHLKGKRASAPASVVQPLFLPDLPVFLRWRGVPSFGSDSFGSLVDVVDRLIVDSTEWPDLPGPYGPLADVFDRVVVSDIAWARTSRWRRQLASLWPGIADVKIDSRFGHRRPGAAACRVVAFATRPRRRARARALRSPRGRRDRRQPGAVPSRRAAASLRPAFGGARPVRARPRLRRSRTLSLEMSDFIEQVKPLIADVPGWLTDEEGEALYELARGCTGKGVIVEIGSWKGKSTICLGRGSLAGASVPIYAIDPHADYRFGDFKANVDRAGITELVNPIASLSQPAADDFHEPIELLFVDGSHEYDLVLEDFEKWVPKVIDGGWVAFHDTTWTAGPRKVVGHAIYRSTKFKDARFVVGSTTVARRVAQNTFADRARNRYVLGVKTAFWLGSTAVKKQRHLLPKQVERLGRRLLRAIQ